MIKLLASDFYRLFHNKIFVGCTAFLIIGYNLVQYAMIALIFRGDYYPAETMLTQCSNYAPIFIGLFTSLFIAADFTEETIRNRIVIGSKRTNLLLSSVIVTSTVAILATVLYFGVNLLGGNLVLGGFTMTNTELLADFLVFTGAAVVISILFTCVVYILGSSKTTPLVCPVVALVFRILAVIVLQKLYPEPGHMSDAELHILTALDRYTPFLHLASHVHWDMASYLISWAVTAAIALAAGIIVINKKELN